MNVRTSSGFTTFPTLLASCLLPLLLAGCGKSDAERDLAEIDAAQQGPAATEAADMKPTSGVGTSTSASAPPIEPVEVRADAFMIGSVLGGDGGVSGTKPVYALTDTLHASVPVSGRPAGTEVKIYWTYQDGSSHKEETKKVESGMKHLIFDFSRATGMKAGSYMVQLDVGGMPAGILDIKVK